MEGGKCPLEKEDVIIDKTNAARSISVSGFPKETTANELVIHFPEAKTWRWGHRVYPHY